MSSGGAGLQPATPQSFPLFDWARLVLASVVVLYHAGWDTWDRSGALAVQVFFALSGWLIGAILLRTTMAGLPRFYFKRATRIWAPYAAAVVLLYGLALLVGRLGEWQTSLVSDLTFTHNWLLGSESQAQLPLDGTGGHFWSISVEEQFYLAAPLVMMLLPLGRTVGAWVAVTAAAMVFSPYFFGAISFGVLAAAVERARPGWHRAGWAQALLAAVVLVGAGMMAVDDSVFPLAAPGLSIAVVLLLARPGRRTSLGKLAGGISYPLYLNHWIGIFAANAIADVMPLPFVVRLAVALGFAILVGYLAYVAIDRRVLASRDRYYSPARGRACGIAAYALLAIGLTLGLTVLA